MEGILDLKFISEQIGSLWINGMNLSHLDKKGQNLSLLLHPCSVYLFVSF